MKHYLQQNEKPYPFPLYCLPGIVYFNQVNSGKEDSQTQADIMLANAIVKVFLYSTIAIGKGVQKLKEGRITADWIQIIVTDNTDSRG